MKGYLLTLVLLGVSWPGLADDQAISIAMVPLSAAALEETGLDLALGYQTPYAPNFSFVYEYGFLQASLPGTQWFGVETLTKVRMQKFFWGGRQSLDGGLVIWGGVSAFLADGDFDLRDTVSSTYGRHFTARGIFAESGVGNQWEIHQNMRVGIDWLAIARPLTSKIEGPRTDTPFFRGPNMPPSAAIDELGDVQYALEKMTLWRALRISVAYTF